MKISDGAREAAKYALIEHMRDWHEDGTVTCKCGHPDATPYGWPLHQADVALAAAAPYLMPDREALQRMFLQTFEDGGLWDGLTPESQKLYWRTKWATTFTDRVLALTGGQEETPGMNLSRLSIEANARKCSAEVPSDQPS